MSDLKHALEREGDRFDLPDGALERMHERRSRAQRRRRVEGMLGALAIVALGVWLAVALAGLGGPGPTPIQPGASLEGTWQTGRLREEDVVTAFVDAGGSIDEGHALFAQLGGGARAYAVITLRFEDGTFVEFESADGGPSAKGYQSPYRISGPQTLSIVDPRCNGTYSFQLVGEQLSLHAVQQCSRHDGPYNTALFASFPLTKQD
jgi:hypothetical protein